MSRLHDRESHAMQCGWCPGPGSNRYGVAPEGFSYSLRLAPLRAWHVCRTGIWSLDFLFTVPRQAG